jgi:hypothetical protein
MAPVLTPKDVVKRIAAECTFVDEIPASDPPPKIALV